MLDLLYTSSKTLSFSSAEALWHVPAWDAMLFVADGGLHKVFRDGTQGRIGSKPTYWGVGGRQDGLFWVNDAANPLCYHADDITAQPGPSPVNQSWPLPGRWVGGDFIDDARGIYLHRNGPAIDAYSLADGTHLWQVSVAGYTIDFLAAADPSRVAVLCKNGKFAVVDYVAASVQAQSTIRPCLCATYDPAHGLVATVESDKRVRIYTATAAPASLAAPYFVPALPQVTRLAGYVVRTRLTGSASEACPGYWIEWEITTATPRGSLEKTYSRTDADGYAENFYFGPAAGGDVGQETITVRVTV